MIWAAAAIGGYLIGSVSFSRIVAGRVDPELELGTTTFGGWREGAVFEVSNVSPMAVGAGAGARYGCLTAILDIAKAFVPVLIVRLIAPEASYHLVVGIAVVAGHNFPLYHGFRGGRGTSPILGALLATAPLAILATIVASQLIGLFLLRDPLLAHFGWFFLLPVYFVAIGAGLALIGWSLGLVVLRWLPAGTELRQYLELRRQGEFRTEAFHDFIEQTHMGYWHKYARRYGLLRYEYQA